MIRRPFRLAVLLLAPLALMGLGAAPADTTQRIAFQIATGSSSGTYFPIGQMLASLISHPPGVGRCEVEGRCGPIGLIAAARASEGSVANVRAVSEGRVSSGLAQADIVADAAEGRGLFKDAKVENVRAIASLFPETVHVVVLAESDIEGLADLRGKRISIDAEGSGTNATARAILSAFKITEKRATFAFENADASSAKLIDGELDAFFFVGGAPLGVVAELAREGKVRLLPIEGKEIDKLLEKAPHLTKAEIAADVYDGIDATPTIETHAVWIVNAGVADDVVYAITRALWHPDNRGLLDSGHPKGEAIRFEGAREGLPVALHPGAERYYAEADADAAAPPGADATQIAPAPPPAAPGASP